MAETAARTVRRVPEVRPAPAPAPVPVRDLAAVPTPALQRAPAPPALLETAEREADAMARRIASQPQPAADSATPKEGGTPLPPSLRRFMEPHFGADFSAVRVHTGESAAAMSRRLNAAAFTQGRDIFFGRGRFQPEEPDGRALIAHELTHTLQQGAVPHTHTPDAITAVPPGVPQRAPQTLEVAGVRLYRTRAGDMVPLPPDMSFEDAARLEAEGLAAERKLGRAPPAPPVPDVRKLAKAPAPKPAAKPPKRARRAGKYRSPPAPRAAELAATLLEAVGESPVARYLARQGTPVLLRGVNHLQRLKRNEQTHADAATKRGQSEQAVEVPRSEEQSHSNKHQVSAVTARVEPAVDASTGKARLQDSLKANLPRTLESLDNFKRDSRGRLMSADVGLVIHADKNAVLANYGDLRRTPEPTPTDHATQDLPPEEAAPPTPALNPARGLVAPLLKEHTDLSGYTQQADQKLKDEGVTQEQLDMDDSGDLAEANRDKRQLAQAALTEPLAMQAHAKQEAATIEKTLGDESARERHAMRAQRKSGLGRTATRQRGAKAALEKKRDDVAKEINRLYTTAQDSVKRKLADLETRAIKRFDDGNAAAARQFEDKVKRELDAYKADRYSGFFGRLRKAKDWLLGMDDLPRVKEIFETNRAAFVRTIDTLVESISADNKRVIDECRAELKDARERIAGYVATLEPGLQGIGSKAAEEMGTQLDALDRSIDKKEQDLRQQLQDKQQAAIKVIDEKIEKMKQEMSGALAKLGRLLLWAAKKFFTWALGQFGYSLSDIEAIINKGVAVLKAIFTQPIRFVKNLIKAARDGFDLFSTHFLKHLKDALFEWLTGSLTGLRLPEVWNAKGIASVVLQLLNISGDAVRRKLILKLGGDERLVARLEQSSAVVKTVFTEGPLAAWEQVKGQAEDLQQQAVTQLRNFVFIEIAKRAAITIAAMFIPGAGIVRAIIGIYDTVVFFIQKARDIARMVGSFLGSIAEIAAGNTAAAAKALEDGLARALKLVIEFLARFLRLSGIPAKIKGVVEKVSHKVESLIDRVLDWLVAQARRLGLAVKEGAKAVAQKITRWWAARKTFKAGDGQQHSLYFVGEERSAVLMLRSDEQPFTDFVNRATTDNNAKRERAKREGLRIAALIDTERSSAPTGATPEALEKARTKKATLVNDLLEELAPHTVLLFEKSLPPTFAGEVNSGRNKADFAVSMSIKPLTMITSRQCEPPTSAANSKYDDLNARREKPGGASFYIKGHLLNQNLGGPGKWDNLTPLSRSGNAQHEVQAEAVVKRTVDAAAIVEYEVAPKAASRSDKKTLLDEIDNSRDPPDAKREKRGIVEAEDYVPASLTVQTWLLDGKQKRQNALMKQTIPNPVPRDLKSYFLATTPRPVPVNLSTDKWQVIATVPGIGETLAKRIVQARTKVGDHFSTYKQLAELVDGIGEKRLETLENEGHIRLFSRN